MELKNRLYPYPVLSAYNDDYFDSSFSVTINPTIGKKEITFDIKVNLKNGEIMTLIEEKQAYIAAHFECPPTSYRELFKLFDLENKITISSGRINQTLQVCFFIIAAEDINNFYSDKFNPLYQSTKFYIEKHNIIAVGEYYKIPIDKDYDDIKSISSIFSIIPNHDAKETKIISELFNDKITIKLPIIQFNHLKVVSKNPANTPITHTMLIVPILVQALQGIKQEESRDNLDEYKWFRALERALIKLNYTLDDIVSKDKDPLIIAQELLDDPITKGIDSLLESTISSGGHDDEN